MRLQDLMMKVINDEPLDESEKEQVRQGFSVLEETSQMVKTWQIPQSKNLNPDYITSAFEIIKSEVLEKDVASLVVTIPSIYNHLLIFSAGRTDYVGDGTLDTDFLGMTFNDDAGANYQFSVLYTFNDATPSVETSYSVLSDVYASVWASDNAVANSTNGGFCFIPHYKGNFYKQALTLTGALDYSNTNNPNISIYNGTWLNTSPIEKITFATVLTGANLKAGSVISIYGMR